MGNGTSTFDIVQHFSEIAGRLKEDFDAHVWLVEIFGRRHSYLAGEKEDTFLPPEIIKISDRYALVSSDWAKIPIQKRDEVISFLKEFL